MAQKKTVRITEDECRAALKDATQEKSMTVRDVAYVIGLARQASLEKEQLPKPDEKEVATVLLSMAEAGCDGVMCAKRGGVDYFFLLVPQSPSGPSGNSECGDGDSSESSSVRLKKTRKRREKKMEDQNQGQEAQVQGGGASPEKKSQWRSSLVGVACIVIGVIVGSAGVYAAMNLRSANAAEPNEKKSEEAKAEEAKKAEPEAATKEDLTRLRGQVDELGKRVDGHDTKIVQIGAKTDVLEKAQKEQQEQYSKYESALAEFKVGIRDVNDALGKDKDGKFQALYNSSGQTWQAATADLSRDIAAEKKQRMSSEAIATLQDPGGYAFVPDTGAQGDNPAVQPQPVPARPVNQVYLANNVNVEEGYAVYWSPQDSAWITIRWNPGVVNSPCTYQMSYYCQNSGCYKWRHCRRMWRKAWKRGW